MYLVCADYLEDTVAEKFGHGGLGRGNFSLIKPNSLTKTIREIVLVEKFTSV